jgi:hypothetical protein
MDSSPLSQQRAVASLQCMFVGDSLAMPVHWYYNPMDILKQFSGGITKLEAAPEHHPSSIMSLHSTLPLPPSPIIEGSLPTCLPARLATSAAP